MLRCVQQQRVGRRRSRGLGAVEVVRGLGGRATHAQLLAKVTEHQLRAAVAAGGLVRVRRGHYALTDWPDDLRAAAVAGGVLSHLSAAVHLGLEVWKEPEKVHVTVPRGRLPLRHKSVRLHWVDLGPEEVSGCSTSAIRTVLDCAATLPFPEALAVVDSLLRRDPDAAAELATAAAARRGRHRGTILRVVRAASPLAANPFESALRGTLLESGITSFEPQVVIRTAQGTFRVDLADTARRIVIEADSFSWHGSRAALHADTLRYNALVAAGWTVLRFSWEQIRLDPAGVVRTVFQVLARSNHARARA